jgi:hypothetical protein
VASGGVLPESVIHCARDGDENVIAQTNATMPNKETPKNR